MRPYMTYLPSSDVQRLVTTLSPKYGCAGSMFGFRKQCVKSVNGSRLSLPCFDPKYCVMRDISAASSALSTKVNLTLGGHCYLGSY